jgi:hypothetical protein
MKKSNLKFKVGDITLRKYINGNFINKIVKIGVWCYTIRQIKQLEKINPHNGTEWQINIFDLENSSELLTDNEKVELL